MDRSAAAGDRLSKLQDPVLGRILSFLPAKEAARAALLSSRWRHVFAGVHTLVLEEPERFSNAISAALLARNRRGGGAPLRALRVAKEHYSRTDSSLVDQWISFALQQAGADGLDLDLRLCCHRSLCRRSYSLRSAGQGIHDDYETLRPPRDEVVSDGEGSVGEVENPPQAASADADSDSDDDTSVLSDKDQAACFDYKQQQERITDSYTITRVVFSCAELRSLSLGFCRLAPPTNVSMPSLKALLLSHVPDPGSDVERLIAGCPCLVDLTLETCDEVTTFSVLDAGVRLRRLALRCCHNLVTVAVDSSELRAFEYRGAVPNNAFLTLHGGCRKIVYCKVDICGEEVSSQEDLIKLRQLLQLFANAQYLHLESARLGMGLNTDVPMRFPDLSSLRHLELRGRLPDNDTAVVAAVSRILEHAPILEALSLIFHPEEDERWSHEYRKFKDDDLLDAHHLDYNPHSTLPVPHSAIPCLGSHVRKINLVHYQGGRAQRTLAKFLLSNAPVMEELCCEVAEGPFWTQTQLMREIKGWVVNKSANTHIS